VAPRPNLGGQIACCHEVQFYSRDELFLDRFTRFIGTALRVGKAVVVVATPSHQDSFPLRLLAEGLDVAAAMDEGRYIALDVVDTLSGFMVNGFPDPTRFCEAASSLIGTAKKAARGEYQRVAACGECAPFLLREGNAEAAVRLEELWDDVANRYGIDILCGYAGQDFHGEHGSGTLRRIIAEHSSVYAR
jgi:hypothetical protein